MKKGKILKKYKAMLQSALEGAENVVSRQSPRTHYGLMQKGRVQGLKEALMILDGLLIMEKTEQLKSQGVPKLEAMRQAHEMVMSNGAVVSSEPAAPPQDQ